MDLNKLKKLIKDHEKEMLRLYKCTAGKNTIGIGHNLDDKGISQLVSDLMFFEDIQEVLLDLPEIFNNFGRLPENIQMVLADMRFQLGGGGIRKFKNMIKAVNNKDWSEMIVQMKDSAWYRQTTNRANDLIRMVREVGNK